MNALLTFVFLPAMVALAFPFPRHGFRPFGKRTHDFESSGNGPDEPTRGIVKVVKLDPHNSAHASVFRRGLVPRTVPSSRVPFPAFLAMGRPGPALPDKFALPPLPHLRRESQSGLDRKKKQGLAMWQKAMNKGDHGKMSIPVTLKDAGKQTCNAVPFTHVRHIIILKLTLMCVYKTENAKCLYIFFNGNFVKVICIEMC